MQIFGTKIEFCLCMFIDYFLKWGYFFVNLHSDCAAHDPLFPVFFTQFLYSSSVGSCSGVCAEASGFLLYEERA